MIYLLLLLSILINIYISCTLYADYKDQKYWTNYWRDKHKSLCALLKDISSE